MESMQFISTKLMAPEPRKGALNRLALQGKLAKCQTCKVSVIQAAAGSGKTTLVSSFLKSNEKVYRWISLDVDDNEMTTFWHYIIEALREDLGEKHEELHKALATLPSKQSIENLLIVLINQLQNKEKLKIILDDFHVIKDQELLNTIEFFIKYTPNTISMMLLTREKPNLYLGQVMMTDSFLEINDADLKLSKVETVDFLNENHPKELSSEEIDQLYHVTEGWIGGLQLISLAMRNHQNIQLDEMNHQNTYMIQYLTNEILNALSQEEIDFLLKTSIFEEFNITICNELLNITNAAYFINKWSDQHLFIVTLNAQEGWFRFHHLFRQFLRKKLNEQDRSIVRALHVKAARIFHKTGDLERSVKHYYAGEEYSEVLKLIANTPSSISRWTYLKKIPLSYFTQHDDLIAERLFYHFCNLEFDECTALMQEMQYLAKKHTCSSLLQFIAFFIHDDMAVLDQNSWSIQDIQHLKLSDHTKAIMYITSAMLLGLKDQYHQAIFYADQALALEKRSQNPYIRYFAITGKCQLLESTGAFKESLYLYETLFELVEQFDYLKPLLVNSLIGIGGIYMKQLDYETAEQYFRKAKEQMKYNFPSLERGYTYNLLELAVYQGNYDEAIRRIEENKALTIYQEHPLFMSSLLKYQLLIHEIDQTTLLTFKQWIEEHKDISSVRFDDQLVYIRILWMDGQFNKALELVDRMLGVLRRKELKPYLVEALLLKIKVLLSLERDQKNILNIVREAVHYSYENDMMYPFAQENETITDLLKELVQKKANDLLYQEKVFIRQLDACISVPTTSTLLTERELEVLHILATGASNKEIANALHISIATVKTHLIHIYEKLNVSNRVEAIERARTSKLIRS